MKKRTKKGGTNNMPRTSRLIISDEKAVYHVMSCTALDGFPLKDVEKDFEISRISRFRYRTRYFKDSGIIGSKEFVTENYQRFKHLFFSKHEKKPKPIKGLEGLHSLKRLSEII